MLLVFTCVILVFHNSVARFIRMAGMFVLWFLTLILLLLGPLLYCYLLAACSV